MNAKEIQKKGEKYCKKYKECIDCPLEKGVCINQWGVINHSEVGIAFTEFEKQLNIMLKEIGATDE